MFKYNNFEIRNDVMLPRERLELEGLNSLSDTVLIKLILGICSENDKNLKIINDVSKVISMNDDLEKIFIELKSVKGIKIAKASSIVAALELFRRKYLNKKKITCPKDCYNLLDKFSSERQEHFIMIALNAVNEVICTNVISIGLANQTIVHPREIFSRAIEVRSVSIILAHNHPSGEILPSKNDIDTTKKLQNSGNIIGIKVIDHIVFAKDKFFSFAEQGVLKFD